MAMHRLLKLVLATALATLVNAIYPSDHWTYSTKLTTENYATKIQGEIDSGKTAPAWNAVVKKYASNDDVVFMDVNLSEERITEAPNGDGYGAGSGGWPTIRYFNSETGISGGEYEKQTEKSMCDELGDDAMMEAYVEEYGDFYSCSVGSGEGCDEREVGFIAKAKQMSMEDQEKYVARLDGMEGQAMKPELLMWVKKRKKILKQLLAPEDSSDDSSDDSGDGGNAEL